MDIVAGSEILVESAHVSVGPVVCVNFNRRLKT